MNSGLSIPGAGGPRGVLGECAEGEFPKGNQGKGSQGRRSEVSKEDFQEILEILGEAQVLPTLPNSMDAGKDLGISVHAKHIIYIVILQQNKDYESNPY